MFGNLVGQGMRCLLCNRKFYDRSDKIPSLNPFLNKLNVVSFLIRRQSIWKELGDLPDEQDEH
jgi:hypothetical protein